MSIAIVLGLLVLAIVLFSMERIGVDVITGMLLVVLVLSGILSTEEAFAAFGSDFLVILAAIFVVTAAIERSGVLDSMAARLGRTGASTPTGLLLWILPFTSVLSAFMNNTTVTALLLAPVIAISKKLGIPPGKVLMALAFSSIVGGSCTLIGTSTNVAVSAYLEKNGIATIAMFDFVWIGVALTGVTLVYMLTIGRWLLPVREGPEDGSPAVSARRYTTEIRIDEGSPLIGTRPGSSEIVAGGFNIASIIRNGQVLPWRSAGMYQAHDLVLVYGDVDALIGAKEKSGISVMADVLQAGDGPSITEADEKDHPLKLVEVLLPPRSTFIGSTVGGLRLLQRYGVTVAGVHRSSQRINERIGRVRLQVGDMLLVQGKATDIRAFQDQHELVSLGEFSPDPDRVRKGYITIGIFLLAVVLGSTGLLPLSLAFVCAALATVLLGINDARTVYHTIDWRLLVLIGGMSAFGTAMGNSGADVFLSDTIRSWFGGMGTPAILAGFMVLTVLLSQPMSNAAAALVVLPIALHTADALGASPITFAMAVMLSASISLITPFEPACILVYGPGRYRFSDFVRVGAPLTVALLVIIFILVQQKWPLMPTTP